MKLSKYFLPISALILIHFNLFAQGLENNQISDFSGPEESFNHHFHPTINPIVPEVISYQHRGRIQIVQDDAKGNRSSILEVNCSVEDTPTAFFAEDVTEASSRGCRYLQWRPTLDHKNRLWFSLISTTTNEILIGYIDSSLNCRNRSNCKYFSLDIDKGSDLLLGITWSPDGEMLLLTHGDRLRLIYDLEKLIENEDPKGYQIYNYTVAEGASLPVWSSDQRFLAYEYFEENRAVDIHVLDFETWVNQNGRKSIIKISEQFPQISNLEATKPSWSNTGHLLSFLVPSISGSDSWDVIVTRLLQDESNIALQLYSSGEHREVRNFKRMFELIKGPVLLSRTEASSGNQIDVMVFVEDDFQLRNPVVRRRLGSQATDTKSVISERDVNNDHVDAVISKDRIRLAYTTQLDGGMQTRIRDLQIVEDGFLDMKTYSNINRLSAMKSSWYYPGLGQFKKQERAKGMIFSVGSTLLLATAIYSGINTQSLLSDYDSKLSKNKLLEQGFKTEEYNDTQVYLNEQRKKINQSKQLTKATLAAFFAVYVYNLFDVQRGFPKHIPIEMGSLFPDSQIQTSIHLTMANNHNFQHSYYPALTLSIQ